MSERDKVSAMLLKLRKIPDSWWYKIPDVRTCGNCGKVATGDKRPFDVIGCYDHAAIAIEFKEHNGKLSPHQTAQLHLWARASGIALLVTLRLGAGVSIQIMDKYGHLGDPWKFDDLVEFLTEGMY